MTAGKGGKRPKAFRVGPVAVRVKRGPKEGRWYFEARWWNGEARVPVWAGWATVAEVQREVAGLVARDELDRPPEPEPECRTVRDLMEFFVAAMETEGDRGDVTSHTPRNARRAGRWLAALVGDVTLEQLDIRDIETFVNRRRERAAASTVHQEVKILRRAWMWGRKRGLTPARDLPTPKDLHLKGDPVRAKFTPTDAQVSKVLAHLTGWPRLALLLLFGTGARISEVATLCWGRVDLDAGILTVAGKRKARDREPRWRKVPILPSLVAELRAWRPEEAAPADLVLGVTRKMVTGHLSSRHLKRACEAAGVPKFSPHGVRRGAVDAFLRAGVDAGTAAAHFGHSPQVMLVHYQQPTFEDQQRGVQRAALGRVPAGDVVPFPGRKAEG